MSKREQERAQIQLEVDAAVAEFLANGGKITQCEYGVSGRAEGASYSQWSKKKPSTSPLAAPPEEDE
jgi:hypothetical protein